MLIHRGRGTFIAIIAILCLAGAEAFTRSLFHYYRYYPQHPWPKFAACLVAAALVRWLSPQKEPAAASTPPQEQWLVSGGEDLSLAQHEPSPFKLTLFRDSDSLFLIPVRYWPALLCALGTILYFVPEAALP